MQSPPLEAHDTPFRLVAAPGDGARVVAVDAPPVVLKRTTNGTVAPAVVTAEPTAGQTVVAEAQLIDANDCCDVPAATGTLPLYHMAADAPAGAKARTAAAVTTAERTVLLIFATPPVALSNIGTAISERPTSARYGDH
jgi:hypothetical protein